MNQKLNFNIKSSPVSQHWWAREIKWVNNVLKDRPDNFKKRLLSVLSSLNENDWEFLERKAKELLSIETDEIPAKNSNNELSATKEMSLKPAYEMTDEEIDEEVEAYRQQLILEKTQEEKSSVFQKNELA